MFQNLPKDVGCCCEEQRNGWENLQSAQGCGRGLEGEEEAG